MMKRLALVLLACSAAVLAAEHLFHYGDLSSDFAEWLDDRGVPLPEADSLLYWVIMPVIGAMALFGLLQGALKVAWITGVSVLVSFAMQYDIDDLTDAMEPVLGEIADVYDDISDDVTSIL